MEVLCIGRLFLVFVFGFIFFRFVYREGWVGGVAIMLLAVLELVLYEMMLLGGYVGGAVFIFYLRFVGFFFIRLVSFVRTIIDF